VKLVLASASMLFVLAPFAQTGAPPKPARSTSSPCLYNADRPEVEDCLHEGTDGSLQVSRRILKHLDFHSSDLAAIHTQKQNWMYVDRAGHVVVRGVPTMDNWADEFHDGLVRFVEDGKYGFANTHGKAVIAASYDGAMPFDSGRAKVCSGCSLRSEGEHSQFVGGTWSVVDVNGAVVTQNSISPSDDASLVLSAAVDDNASIRFFYNAESNFFHFPIVLRASGGRQTSGDHRERNRRTRRVYSFHGRRERPEGVESSPPGLGAFGKGRDICFVQAAAGVGRFLDCRSNFVGRLRQDENSGEEYLRQFGRRERESEFSAGFLGDAKTSIALELLRTGIRSRKISIRLS
jgi:hypothetical protein